MTNFVAGLVGILIATNQVAAASNFVAQTTGIHVSVPDPNDPVEKEYKKLLEADDVAQGEVDQWIRENQAFADKGGGVPPDQLNARIQNRFQPIIKGYEDFIAKHPDHARVRLAYGSFLTDIKREEEGAEQFEKARQIDPSNPAAWNQLANYYGHRGPIQKAFPYYEKAIELSPKEPVYYQNLATTVYLFRKDSQEYYHINEQQVFDKAMALYKKATELDPTNFELAQDVAQTYYGIRPPRAEEALKAWTNCLNLAEAPKEAQGVHIHLARWKLKMGRTAEARHDLAMVTDPFYNELKARLMRNIEQRENDPNGTNSPAKPSNSPSAQSQTNTSESRTVVRLVGEGNIVHASDDTNALKIPSPSAESETKTSETKP